MHFALQTSRGNFEWEDHIWNRYLSSWAALTQGRATIAYPMFDYRPKKNAPSAFTASGSEFI